MEIREARYFFAVAKMKSFSQAARHLGMTQPALSQAIQKLERDIGLVLFERTSRSVSPTPAALALLPEAESLLRRSNEIDQLQARLRAGDRVDAQMAVRVGSVPSVLLGLLPSVMPYLTGVNMLVYEMDSATQRRAIDAGDIDVGFVREWPMTDLRITLLRQEPLLLALPAVHPLAAESVIDLRDVSDEPFISFPRDTAPAAFDSFTAACRAAGFAPQVRHLARNDQAIIGMVACGLGVSLVPAMLAAPTWPGVVLRPLTDSSVTVPLGVIAPTDDPQGYGQLFYAASSDVLRA